MAKRRLENNRKIFAAARRRLVGGVDSPARAFGYVGCLPPVIRRGIGSKIYDEDGNKYIDYLQSWGAMILGHANREVVEAVGRSASRGSSFGATVKAEVELAEMICAAVPMVEKIRFVNSGTEAVMGALRLARGYTGRDKIVKFKDSYHGHADYLLAKTGSGMATLGIPDSAGVPKDMTRHTLVAPYNDVEAVERVFKKDGHNIAAVIVEPVAGNAGVVAPDIRFIRALRDLSGKCGSLLIFDEVITGFRFCFGSVSELFGVRPDLVVFGKIIGGGLPAGAYGGKRRMMDRLAPVGNVYQASTFAGNPLTMSAGLATLKILKRSREGYKKTRLLAERLVSGIGEIALEYGAGLKMGHYVNMFSISFNDKNLFGKFYRAMLNEGIYFAPSEFEANFLSMAHTGTDVEKTIKIARDVLRQFHRRGSGHG